MVKPALALLPADTSEASKPMRTEQPSPAMEAAQQFEQIFLRKMLSSMMQSAKMGGGSQLPGSEMYDSLVVDALASALSAGGGIGLATIIEQRLESAKEIGSSTSPTSRLSVAEVIQDDRPVPRRIP